MVGAKLLLALVAGGVTAIVLGGSIALALRFRPVERSELGALVRRYRDRMGPAHVWLLVAVVVFLTAAHRRQRDRAVAVVVAVPARPRPRPAGSRARHRPRLPPVRSPVPHDGEQLDPPAPALRPRPHRVHLRHVGRAAAADRRPAIGPTGARPSRPDRRRLRRGPGARLRLRAPAHAGHEHRRVVRRRRLHRAQRGRADDVGARRGRPRDRVPARRRRPPGPLAPRHDRPRRLGRAATRARRARAVARPALRRRPGRGGPRAPVPRPQPRRHPRRLPARHRRPGRDAAHRRSRRRRHGSRGAGR